MNSPALFQRWFPGESWDRWRAVLRAVTFGLAAVPRLRPACSVYGARPEVVTRLSWNALLHLASPAIPTAAREKLEARILAGKRIGAPQIRAARLAHAADQPARRMAA
jgi:hypothetical protein